jgi:hypothetical protein
MEQPEVGPKGEGVGTTESNRSDEHRSEATGARAFAARMGRENKNSASKLDRFLLFLYQSQPAGII